MKINGHAVSMVFDTGADVSILNEATFRRISTDSTVLEPVTRTIRAYNGGSIDWLGQAFVLVETSNISKTVKVLVVKGNLCSCIYGSDWIEIFDPDFRVSQICDRPNAKAELLLKDDAVPVFCKPRPLPFGIREAVKEELDRLVSEGILTPVDQSDWATPIVPVRKPSGQFRICGDYKITLNPRLKDMVSTTPQIEDIISNLHNSSWFSEIDLVHAFHQISLDLKSSEMTTISTPFGLYRYDFLPFGIKQSPAIFQSILDRILNGIDGVEIYQDNIYVHGLTKEEHDARLREVQSRLLRNNLEINQDKSSFAKREINVLGTIVSENKARPDPKKVEIIQGFQTPSSVSEVRSFLGLIDFYGRYIRDLSTRKEPLTRLLKKNYPFSWKRDQAQAFENLKNAVTHEAVLTMFDPKKEVTLMCDASPVGVGAVLQQEGRPVLFVSKTLSQAERGYSQIEREALSIVWSIKRLHKYLFGRNFNLVTDNKSLSYIFSSSKAIPVMTAARLQRWALFLIAYNYRIIHQSGKNNQAADTLSRYPTTFSESGTFDVFSVQETVLPCPINKSRILAEARRNDEMRFLYQHVKFGWPQHGEKNDCFYKFRDEFSLQDSLVYRGLRLVIPDTLRNEVLCRLHEGHIGADAMKSIARQSVWWPSIDQDIAFFVKKCDECCTSKNYTRKIQTNWPEETQRWSRVHIDFAGPLENGEMALIMVDAYSRWPEVHLMSSTTSTQVIKRLRRTFAQEGVPNTLVSDNGRQFVSEEMEMWLTNIGCKHILTPPYHPRSNGLAERFVRTLKDHLRCVKGTNNLQASVDRFLMQYRNSKHSTTGVPPSVRMRGKLLRSPITALNALGDKVWVRKHLDPDRLWKPARVVGMEGRNLLNVLDDEGKPQRYHVEDTKRRIEEESDDLPIRNEKAEESGRTKSEDPDPDPDIPTNSPDAVAVRPKRLRRKPVRYGVD